jgi:hypothetical protein
MTTHSEVQEALVATIERFEKNYGSKMRAVLVVECEFKIYSVHTPMSSDSAEYICSRMIAEYSHTRNGDPH